MGNSCSKRTIKEVTDDLESDLLTSAKHVLEKDFQKSLASGAGLQDAVGSLAKAEFSKEFKYDWNSNGGSVHPPDLDKADPRVMPVEDYCIIPATDDIPKAVADYIKRGLDNVHLDNWMKDNASADLAAAINKFIAYPVDTEWHLGTSTLQYDAVIPKGATQDFNQDSYKIDLSLVYTNATKTESAVEVSLHVFYFVGVYYTVESPKAKTFAELRQEAWNSAQKLTNQATISSDTGLKDDFYAWGTSDSGPFKKDFQRSWGHHASDFATDEKEPVDTSNSVLAFFQTNQLTEDYLNAYIAANILSGINLPTKAMTDWVKGVLVQQYKSIVSQPNTSGWTMRKLDQSFGLGNASVRPIRLNGELVYWAKTKDIMVANQQVTVYAYYVYFLGNIYDLEPDPLYKDLSKTLIESIPGHAAVIGNFTPDDVKKAVVDFNKTRFDDAYTIQFPLKDHDISEKKANWWKGFLEFDHWNPTKDEIMNEISDKLFQRDPADDTQIHHGLQPKVFDWISKIFGDLAGDKSVKDPNGWYTFTKEDSFPYVPKANKPDDKWVLGTRTSWAYCNGTITESSHGDQTLKHFCLSVLIYIDASADAEGSSDV